ncbi:MAG: hypothetical protein E7552_01715 [Ruminococcaceae bacterium]|nr:hypothetical protein [Oscillospiraceae bacterium]
MKGVGLCLIVTAGGMIGCMRVAALRERERALGVMCRFVDWLIREIRYTAAPLDTLLHRAKTAFSDWPLLERADSFERWRISLPKSVKQMNFTEEDAACICRFAEELGCSDVTGQLAHGAFYAALFEERRQEAHCEAEKRGRLELMLWTGGAAVLALLWM